MTRKPPADNPHEDWLSAIADVTPLGTKPAPQGKSPAPLQPTEAQRRAMAGVRHHDPFPLTSNTAFCIAGAAPHQDKSLLKDLAKGKFPPTAVLDLHGLGEGDAWLHLMDFLHAAADADHRCALVIHGKGRGYGPLADMGVIKFQIGSWLAGHPKVLAFHTSLPEHGGSGAIYVYLRRRTIV